MPDRVVYWPEYKTAAWDWSRYFEGFATQGEAEATIARLSRNMTGAAGLEWRVAKVTESTEHLPVTPDA